MLVGLRVAVDVDYGGGCSLNRLKSWPGPRIKTRHRRSPPYYPLFPACTRIESWWFGPSHKREGLLLGIRGIKRILGGGVVISIFLFGYPAPYLNTIFRQRIYNPCNPLSEVFLRLPVRGSWYRVPLFLISTDYDACAYIRMPRGR